MAHFYLLAFASALYPLLLAATVIMLSGEHPVRVLTGYLVGGAIVSIGIGVALLHIADASGALHGTTERTVYPWADIVLGALALAIGIGIATGVDTRLRRRRRRRKATPAAPTEPWSQRALGKESAKAAFVVGMCLSLPSVYYLSALAYLSDEFGVSPRAYSLLVVFNVIQFAIVEIPLACYLVAPEATRDRVRRADLWLSGHWRSIAQWVALGIGAYLVVRGIVHLAS